MSQNGNAKQNTDSENVFSPERQSYDNESIYSFDSVSTSGRLLDRLDLDADDYNDYDAASRRRESAVSVGSIGRSWDFGSEELAYASNADLRQIPIRANSSVGLDRMRSVKKHGSVRSLSQNNRIPVQAVPGNLVHEKKTRSVDSLHVDISSRYNSSSSLPLSDPIPPTPSKLHLNRGNSRSHPRLLINSPITESVMELSSPSRSISPKYSPVTSSRPAEPQSPASLISQRSVSSSSNESNTSLESAAFILNATSRFDPSIDAATRKALAVRAQGNHREASYQLQTLANGPYNYPKAMYLYAKALKIGQGVKLNEAHSIKWLCRCILTSHIAEKSPPESRPFMNYVSQLANLPPDTLLEMLKINNEKDELDPFSLMEKFQSLGQSAVNKIGQLNSSDKNVVGTAYYLLADSLLKGQGVPMKDETTGRLLLAKSASLAYADAMAKLGELWCSKTKHFKKDYHIASAWLRLGEFFGKKDIGNSWIYKSKYMEPKKK
ncbi:hypothetical protein JCM33374_g1377 [Metschnikowia sp. JCM 33374]|nr:hypothetical protein JCM33374_g1377 [Metschnikowia sp. JCM 33374]